MSKIRIWNLRPNLSIGSITVQIVSKPEPREANTKFGMRYVCNCEVSDGTGVALLSVWEADIFRINEGNIVNIRNGNCTYWENNPQINFKNGVMTILEEENKDFLKQNLEEACYERLPLLLKTAEHVDAEKRLWTAKSFIKMKEMAKIAQPTLIKLLNDVSDEVRQNAISAIMNIKHIDQTLFTAILRALKDRNYRVRVGAVLTISHLDGRAEETIPQLIELIKDENSNVRLMVATALRALIPKSQSVKSTLVKVMKTNDVELKWRAFELLVTEDVFVDKDKSFLLKLLKDNDNRIRKKAALVLEKMGYYFLAYKTLLESNNTEIINEAFKEIRRLDIKGKSILEDALDNENEYVRSIAENMLRRLIEKKKDFKERADRKKQMFDDFHSI